MLARGGRGDQVEGPGAEPVGRAGQRADRADLHRVAGEVGLEVLVPGRRRCPPAACAPRSISVDERVAGDLLGEAGAAGALDAAFAVEQHLGGDVDRLGEGALEALEPGLAAPVGHRLVLQRALAALVADRAVERVVDQQQLHHALLRLVGHRRGVLGLDDHAVGDRHGARGQRLALPLDLDQALPAGADRVEQRVVAEARDGDAEPLGDPDDQLALLRHDRDPVDGQLHVPRRDLELDAVALGGDVSGGYGHLSTLPSAPGPTPWYAPDRRGSRRGAGGRGTRPGSTGWTRRSAPPRRRRVRRRHGR